MWNYFNTWRFGNILVSKVQMIMKLFLQICLHLYDTRHRIVSIWRSRSWCYTDQPSWLSITISYWPAFMTLDRDIILTRLHDSRSRYHIDQTSWLSITISYRPDFMTLDHDIISTRLHDYAVINEIALDRVFMIFHWSNTMSQAWYWLYLYFYISDCF